MAAGVATRAAAFSSRTPARDVVRLAGQENVDLLLVDVAQPGLSDDTAVVLEQAPCDVAMLVGPADRRAPARCSCRSAAPGTTGRRSSSARGSRGPTDAPLRLIGAVSDGGGRGTTRAACSPTRR